MKTRLCGLLLLFPLCFSAASAETAYAPETVRPTLERVQRAAFRHFWDCGNRENGMIHASEHVNNGVFTVGGSGFGAMTVIVGVSRGWISREAGVERVVRLVRFLDKADRFHGVWPHWFDGKGQAVRFGDQVRAGDLVETAFVMMGLYCAQAFFDGGTPAERELRETVERFRRTVEWQFYTGGGPDLYWLWESTTGAFSLSLRGYNEALITWILALGAPGSHAVSPEVYHTGWRQNGRIAAHKGKESDGSDRAPAFFDKPLFLSHYTFLGVDPRSVADADFGDYFLLGLRHTLANRRYCLRDAPKVYGYDAFNWGLTACAGPKGKGYVARSPKCDDGILAPTAALASIIYTPFYSTQVLMALAGDPTLLRADGPVDAYCPADGWRAGGCIAIDQGPIVIMIENYRSGLLWRLLARHPDVVRGLARAGLRPPVHTTGFPYLRHARQEVGEVVALMRHPDRGQYEVAFALETPAEVAFVFRQDGRETIRSARSYGVGTHTLEFSDPALRPGQECELELKVDGQCAERVRVFLQ